MRIEVLIGSEGPKYYPLNKQKLSLGSSASNDVVIQGEGVSRKHAQIVFEDDKYFVIDQGSTNGSYINEERLTPGKRAELTSFFPLRLGARVLISLQSTDSDLRSVTVSLNERKRSEQTLTKQISLKDLKKSSAEKILSESKSSKKSQPQKTNSEKRPVPYLAVLGILLLLGAGYYNFFLYTPEVEGPVAQVGEIIKVVPEQEVPPKTEVQSALPEPAGAETFNRLLNDLKCTTESEKFLCERIAEAQGSVWGAVQVGSKVHVLLDGTKFHRRAEDITPSASTETKKAMAIALFIVEGLPDLDSKFLDGLTLNFGLFRNQGETNEFITSFVLDPKSLSELKQKLTPDVIREDPSVILRERVSFL